MRILSFLSFLFLLLSCGKTEKNLLTDTERQSPLVTNDISNQQITAFGEDEKGHVWIGTFRGLNKFSVNEYHQYFCTDDSLDIPDNHIQDIFLDSKKRLWISTVNGICLYTDEDNFKNIRLSGGNKNGIRISESSKGKILLTTMSNICLYDSLEERFDPVVYDFDTSYVFNSFLDAQDNCWVITSKELRCYSLSDYRRTFSTACDEFCHSAYLFKNGELWIAGNQSLPEFGISLE